MPHPWFLLSPLLSNNWGFNKIPSNIKFDSIFSRWFKWGAWAENIDCNWFTVILLKSSVLKTTVTNTEPLLGYVIIILLFGILSPVAKDTRSSSINSSFFSISLKIIWFCSHPKSNLNSCFFKLVNPLIKNCKNVSISFNFSLDNWFWSFFSIAVRTPCLVK